MVDNRPALNASWNRARLHTCFLETELPGFEWGPRVDNGSVTAPPPPPPPPLLCSCLPPKVLSARLQRMPAQIGGLTVFKARLWSDMLCTCEPGSAAALSARSAWPLCVFTHLTIYKVVVVVAGRPAGSCSSTYARSLASKSGFTLEAVV